MANYTPALDYNQQPFGLDISSNQGMIDWDKLANGPLPVKFVGIRLGISWGYADKWFARNWAEAKRVGCHRAAYHALYPGEAIKPQIDLIAKLLGGDMGDLPFVPDIELSHNLPYTKIRTAAYEYVNRIRDLIKRTPIIYTRAEWWNTYVTGPGDPPEWYQDFDWWLALYLSSGLPHPGPLTAPRGVPVERILVHQVSDHTPSLGYGIKQLGKDSSKMLDYDRWLGTPDSLLKLAGVYLPPPVMAETQLDRIERGVNELLGRA